MPKATQKRRVNGRTVEATCIWCGSTMLAYWLRRHFAACPKLPPIKPGERMCSRCQHPKPKGDFPLDSNRREGVASNCRSCDRALSSQWYANPANADKQWRRILRFHYNITPEDYFAALESQRGVCALCGASPSGTTRAKRLHVDHDHQTDKFRGLLCHHCNHGLGKFQDDPELMFKAANWVLRHRGLAEVPYPIKQTGE